jgi:ParB-like chromosome segregation protein Spo0J
MSRIARPRPTQAPGPSHLPIDSIKVGPRFRRDMGDIDALAANIREIGLLHPIPVKPDGELIAGARRLAACKQLGWTEIPVNVVNIVAVVKGEDAENKYRKDFTPSEAVAIKRAVEQLEKAAAKERQGTRTDKHPGKLPTSSKGRAADKAAERTGIGRRSLEKAEAVVEAAEAEPERFGKLVEHMDRTGKVDGAHRKLLEARGGDDKARKQGKPWSEERRLRVLRKNREASKRELEAISAGETARLNALHTENAALRDKLAKAEAELTKVKAELAKVKAERDKIIAAQVNDDVPPPAVDDGLPDFPNSLKRTA